MGRQREVKKPDAAQKVAAVAVERMKLEDIVPAEYNPRAITEDALKGLGDSVREFGYVELLVFNKRTGRLVSGHQRLKVLEQRGFEEADVVVVDLDEAGERALNLTMNNEAIQGEWVDELLKSTFDYFSSDECRTDDIGELLTKLKLDKIEWKDEVSKKIVEDEVPDIPTKAITKKGDLWELEKHRILCGDATNTKDMKLAMKSEIAIMSFTDPPYGVDYGGHNNPRWSQKHASIKNDALSSDNMRSFWSCAFIELGKYVSGDLYVAAPSGPLNVILASALCESSFVHHQWLVWVKDRLVLGRSNYHYRHEHLWYGWKKGDKSSFIAGRDQDSVWEFKRPLRSDEHPTMKPVELVAKAIKNSCKIGSIVVDPFLGSGTTVIAAEQSDRICYGLEIEPKYCDVIVERWQNITGKKAKRIRI